MNLKKLLVLAVLLGTASFSITSADDFADTKTALNQSIASLIARYESKIKSLEDENKILRNELTALKGTGTASVSTPTVVTASASVDLSKLSKADVYSRVMDQLNANLSSILSANNLDGSGAIGLFEFVDPNAVFISIDNGKNPTGVTAFKTKILFSYDNALNFTKTGLFDLDYTSGYYITKFGSNPFAKATRTRIQNPSYKGRLFDTPTTSTGTTNVGTTSSGATVSDVTFAQVKAAYDKNKLLDALKLSDSYIAKNPNDVETLKIRYRSYYIVGKYTESLAEVKKIETVSGSSFDKTIACDAAVIAKIAKKTDLNTYYSGICKKK